MQQVEASDGAFAALRGDGRVVTWGDPAQGADCRRVQDAREHALADGMEPDAPLGGPIGGGESCNP